MRLKRIFAVAVIAVFAANMMTVFPAFAEDRVLTGIFISVPPDRTEYLEGEYFDPTGMIVIAEYDNGDTEEIGNYTFDVEALYIQMTQVTIYYGGLSADVGISVREKMLVDVTITKPPSKIIYIEGETFDPAGMVVTAVYDNGDTEPVDWYTCYDQPLTRDMTAVTVTYDDISVDVSIIVQEKSLTGLFVDAPPSKTVYVEGEYFEPEGMVVTASFDNGDREEITEYTVDIPELRLGMTKVTVSYNGMSADIPVTVVQKTLIGIRIEMLPHKTVYLEGQVFEPAGMAVAAEYNNGDLEPVTDYFIVNQVMTPGTTKVLVMYNGMTAEVNVTVKVKMLIGISVFTPPSKTEYIEGQTFSTDGMTVMAVYDNNTVGFITGYTFSPPVLTLGTTKVTISYGGKTVDVSVTVRVKSVTGIAIKNVPDKTTYFIGEDFDASGLEITVTYDNGATGDILMTGSHVTGFNSASRGTKTLNVVYEGASCTLTVTVISVRGDIDGDGKVDIGDIVLLRDYILGIRSLSAAALTSADADQDGEVDIQDIVAIRDHILGISAIPKK